MENTIEYLDRFLELDEIVQSRLLAYCRIREQEEATARGLF